MRTSLALAASVLLLAASAGVAFGITRQKSCRACTCTVNLLNTAPLDNGYAKDIKDIMDYGVDNFTGGDGYYWKKVPTKTDGPTNWQGEAYFWRLCGNGGKASGTWQKEQWKGQITNITLQCDVCDRSAQCNDGSKCQYSGIKG